MERVTHTEEWEARQQRFDREQVVRDYQLAYQSRQASVIGRREVLSGKAKFGIFGDGKETPQVALAHFFKPGDWRSGYYRDQTLMLALDIISLEQFFAQLYAHPDVAADPSSAGRQMNAHFASRLLDEAGEWRDQTEGYNIGADLSPTGSQMPKLVGLAYASRLYRELEELHSLTRFSRQGAEVAFGMIGNATCAEGMFWEAINAVAVLRSPMVLSIWDDGYGISVPNELQVAKESISDLLQGFQREPGGEEGLDVYVVRAWDYPNLMETYRRAVDKARKRHVPAVVHVIEVTQPQGHSTSGSHERYKSAERMAWETEYDCVRRMRDWLLTEEYAPAEALDALEKEWRSEVEAARERAWEAFIGPIRRKAKQAGAVIERAAEAAGRQDAAGPIAQRLTAIQNPWGRDIMAALQAALIVLRESDPAAREELMALRAELHADGRERYTSHLMSASARAAVNVAEVKPEYAADAPLANGFEVLNTCFDAMLARDPRVIAFGEDVGALGDVNQGFAGLQAKYGPLRVSDTGIREITIAGQAIGMALRGLRPIAEIQYLDYLLYAIQILSDDLATLHWRTRGGQAAPAIIRTRGHRLEGIWHSGSPMAAAVHLLRGMHVLVPRNMTQAAGFYNTLLDSDEPGLVVEVLNAYRLKEPMPANIGGLRLPVGVPEVLRPGDDLSVVTYGALCRIALEAAEALAEVGVSAEVIDVQSLLPFDIHGRIGESVRKTGRVLFVDEDVPGGTTAYMLREVLETQGAFWWLDSEPRTLPAAAHRPAYGSDGDYWSKPNAEQIFALAYEMMNEADPGRYPDFLGRQTE
ncbi:MAG: alpha-ketoacid dehydrogenase subunit alpha/beta [Candidatus Promineifilaceae bacterium]